MKLTEDEETALSGFSIVEGCDDARTALIDKYRPALESLIEKGVLKQVWVIDEDHPLVKSFTGYRVYHNFE